MPIIFIKFLDEVKIPHVLRYVFFIKRFYEKNWRFQIYPIADNHIDLQGGGEACGLQTLWNLSSDNFRAKFFRVIFVHSHVIFGQTMGGGGIFGQETSAPPPKKRKKKKETGPILLMRITNQHKPQIALLPLWFSCDAIAMMTSRHAFLGDLEYIIYELIGAKLIAKTIIENHLEPESN